MDETTQIPVVNSQPTSSEIDARFRPQYRVLSELEKAQVGQLKEEATRLAFTISKLGPGRYQSLALTALEESIMWAVKAATGPR